MGITVGRVRHRLHKGDSLAMELDQPVGSHNPAGKRARYSVIIADTRSTRP